MPYQDPRELLVNIVKILNKLDIPYMIVGGMAVFVWGRPRFTADIDIIIALEKKDAGKLVKILRTFGKAGYVSEEAVNEAVSRKTEFNFIDGETGVKIDFWILKNDAFGKSQMTRRVPRTFLRNKIYFISPEDLILSKLEWHKISQSSKHLEDAESILRISKDKLDKNYLNQWAKKLGVSEILNKIILEKRDLRK